MLSLLLGAHLLLAGGIELNTVVIDAGHGGKDAGAVSKDKKSYEKTFTLSIATQLAEKIRKEYPGVKVVLTRSTDKFVELRDRAGIANKAGANLFISIHINSAVSTSANGYSVHILGQSSNKNRDLFAYNMDVVKRENSVILLEDDYSTKYQGFDPSDDESNIFMSLMQNAYLEQSLLVASIISEKLKGGPIKADRGIWQNPFYVLWKTAMPSVLVELGFISNATDLAALRQDANRTKIAECLFNAFKEYKELYDSSMDVGQAKADKTAAAPAPKNEEAKAPSEPEKAYYGTQIFASSRIIDSGDPAFLGYTHKRINIGSLNKYIIGICESESEAREEYNKIKEKYSTCFMVKITPEGVTRFKAEK
ncbi:MAG: N-acetylmuramoyl-L-alanine amidase [Bacteroidales bacterium]|nr:N-acetylmuramoyl-L-alanine amidase [Bacteroidales bacterium]